MIYAFHKFSNLVCLLGWCDLVGNAGPDVHVAGFARDHQEETELANRRGNRTRLQKVRNANGEDFPGRNIWMRIGGCQHRRLGQTGGTGRPKWIRKGMG